MASPSRALLTPHDSDPGTALTRSVNRRFLTSLLVGSTLLAMCTGCSGDAGGAPSPSASSALPSSSPSLTESEIALSQYEKFWRSLTPISRMTADLRRKALAQLAADPALKSLLAGMARTESRGQIFYGADIPHPQPIRMAPDERTAVVDDCQDSTHTGLAKKSTGARLTAGVRRNHVVVTMKRDDTGTWKIAFVSYTKTPC